MFAVFCVQPGLLDSAGLFLAARGCRPPARSIDRSHASRTAAPSRATNAHVLTRTAGSAAMTVPVSSFRYGLVLQRMVDWVFVWVGAIDNARAERSMLKVNLPDALALCFFSEPFDCGSGDHAAKRLIIRL